MDGARQQGVALERPFHVLIVDQRRTLCQRLAPLLERVGCRVDCLSATVNPFGAIRELGPDLVILEIVSTEVEGLEILRRLESRRTAQKIPVIVTSPRAELEYELPDVFDFLPQPLDQERLLEDLALLAGRQGRVGAGSGPYPSLTDQDLERFQAFLITHSGLHFDRRNSKLLERGLMRRMRALGTADYLDYFRYLEEHHVSRQELKKLLALLTIGETYFFRYLAHYEALLHHVLPEVIQRNQRERRLCIWSAGCSTGEEAYSIAMLLLEKFPQLADWQVSILATDINKQALRKARQGLFGNRSLRVTDQFYRQRYFRPVGSGYLLDERVRRMVRFGYLNLQTGVYPSPETGTSDLDLLFCRNVLIYFRLATTRRMVERFSRCLRPGGYLFLGHAETLMNINSGFQRVQNCGGFYYRLAPAAESTPVRPAEQLPKAAVLPPPHRPPKPAPAPPPPVLPEVAEPAPEPEAKDPDPAELFREAELAFNRENFKTASHIYDTILRLDPRHVGALVGKGFIQANQGESEKALACCLEALAVDDLCAEAYFLQGLIRELEQEPEAAVAEYRKALLLDMDFIMAHYNLGKVFRRLDRAPEARRELNNTLRLLEAAPDESLVPYSGGLSRAVFLEVCREEAAQGMGG